MYITLYTSGLLYDCSNKNQFLRAGKFAIKNSIAVKEAFFASILSSDFF